MTGESAIDELTEYVFWLRDVAGRFHRGVISLAVLEAAISDDGRACGVGEE